MGKLAETAKRKSPYIRLEIGEKTVPLIYKSWKEITDNFGNDSFRYYFELETDQGFISKQFDNGSQAFAEQLDKIPINSKIVIARLPKKNKDGIQIVDKDGKQKSIYIVMPVDKIGEIPETVQETKETSDGETPEWAKEVLDGTEENPAD